MTKDFYEAVKYIRSIYGMIKKRVVSYDRIIEIIE